MNRLLNLLDFTLYSLLRRKWKNLFLMLLFAYLIFLFTSVLLLTGAIKEEARKGVAALPDITVQKLAAGRQVPIPESEARKLEEIYGIRKLEARVWGYYFDASTQANYSIIGYDPERDTWKDLGTITSEDRGKLAPGEAILGQGVIQARGLRLGQPIGLQTPSLHGKTFRLKGSFLGATNLHTYDVILLTLEDARGILGLEKGLVSDLAIYVHNRNELTTIAKKVTEMIPGIRVVIKTQMGRTYDTVYNWKSGFTLITLIGCLLAFAMMVWDRGSGLSAEEKREIGILKATGWDTSDILTMKFWESLIISLPSFLAGLIASYVYTFIFGAPILKSLIIGWSALYPPFRFTPVIRMDQILVLLFLTVIPYVICTIVPSWKAAVIDPDTVIRGV